MTPKLAISSMSLGRCFAGHSLIRRLDAAQKYGYQGIEIFYEDLADAARQLAAQNGRSKAADVADADLPADDLLAAASAIREQCRTRNVVIVNLRPFMNYEGLRDRAAHARRIAQWRLWLKLVRVLGTSLILVASTFLPPGAVTDDPTVLAADLAELADLAAAEGEVGSGSATGAAAAAPPIRVCYEGLCWGTYVNTWEASWAVVRRANRPNLGICLDSFNIAGRLYADPTAASGITPNANRVITASLSRLVSGLPSSSVDDERLPPSKVYLVQLADAERLAQPLQPSHPLHHADQPARMSWSRNCRLFYGEAGGYLPTIAIVQAILHGLGYNGWVSFELFNRRTTEPDPAVPEEMARRGAVSWRKLVDDLAVDTHQKDQNPFTVSPTPVSV